MQGPQAVRSWEALSWAALQLWERASPEARSREQLEPRDAALRLAALRLTVELRERVLADLQRREQRQEQSPGRLSPCRQRSCG
jgi:hypothetical protein